METILDNYPQDMIEHRGNKTRFASRRVHAVSAQLGFRSLNSMKFVYVGYSLSK